MRSFEIDNLMMTVIQLLFSEIVKLEAIMDCSICDNNPYTFLPLCLCCDRLDISHCSSSGIFGNIV